MIRTRTFFLWLALACALPGIARAQTPAITADTLNLSLQEAIARAARTSEEVRLAQSQTELAEAQVREARSQALPQISGTAGYTRTLASAFDTGGGGFTLPDSLQFNPNPNASIEERLRYLETHTQTAALGGLGQLFGNLPFGQENAYSFSIAGSQLLYAGGRTGAALNIAQHFQEAAEYNLREQLADIELQIRSAYYQAQFAQQLIGISEAVIERAQRFLEEEQLRLRAGRASDLDVLRAQVELENLRPQLVQARNTADLSLLNLKRLVNISTGQPIHLTTELTPPTPEERAETVLDPEVTIAQRAALRAAQQQVAIREQQVRIAKGAYLPSVSLSTSYGKQLFPSTLFGFDQDWRTDWTVSLGVQIPIFNGFQRSAQVQQAKVELNQSRLQLSQLEENIELQYEQAVAEKQRALAQVDASQRNVEQAERVYQLTELQYNEGQATQLEVFSAQLALLQARTNYAQALADYYVASAGANRALGVVSPSINDVAPVNTTIPSVNTPQAAPETTPAPTTTPSPTGRPTTP